MLDSILFILCIVGWVLFLSFKTEAQKIRSDIKKELPKLYAARTRKDVSEIAARMRFF